MKTRVPLGTTYSTPGAMSTLHPEDVLQALERHSLGDWGDVCQHDREENEYAVDAGYQLHSVYRDRHGTRFWVITEADRSATTVLLPDEY